MLIKISKYKIIFFKYVQNLYASEAIISLISTFLSVRRYAHGKSGSPISTKVFFFDTLIEKIIYYRLHQNDIFD